MLVHAVITRVATESGGFCSQIPVRCYRSLRIHGMMHANMRICIVYDCLFPHTVGGAERWYRNLAERLAEQGHEVTYLTLRQWDRGERADIDERVRVVSAGPRMALYTA